MREGPPVLSLSAKLDLEKPPKANPRGESQKPVYYTIDRVREPADPLSSLVSPLVPRARP